MQVTPEIAKSLLDGCPNKQEVNYSKVQEYIDLIKLGQSGNRPVIIIGNSGEIFNGNHRLSAIVLSNLPLEIEVKYCSNKDEAVLIISSYTVKKVIEFIPFEGETDKYSTLAQKSIDKNSSKWLNKENTWHLH